MAKHIRTGHMSSSKQGVKTKSVTGANPKYLASSRTSVGNRGVSEADRGRAIFSILHPLHN